eukprot:COSAG01_NODE_1910_length_8928_cov_33.079964_4_plen_340_part_00
MSRSALALRFATLQHARHDQRTVWYRWHLGYYNDSCAPWSRGFDTYMGYLNGVAGYYCNHQDFHECQASNSSAAVAAAAAPSVGRYLNQRGRMDAGPDATGVSGGASQSATYAQAVKLCDDAGSGCYGFSFRSDEPQPTSAVAMTFKRATAVDTNASGWQSYVGTDVHPPSCAWNSFSACSYNLEGTYSTHAYTKRAQDIVTAAAADAQSAPIFGYIAWQAVHEPMAVPANYLEPYLKTKDPSRRIYAGMLSALDSGLGNITQTLKDTGLYGNSVLVLSNDNGGMSGSYGLGCCNCGTSCGGLNYPYRGCERRTSSSYFGLPASELPVFMLCCFCPVLS